MIRFFLFAIQFRNVFLRINNVLVECGGEREREKAGSTSSWSSEFDTNEKNQNGRVEIRNKPRPGHK